MDTVPVHTDDPPVIDTEGVTHDDTNLESKILFTMNVDTQEVNIVVDKDNTEVKVDNVDSGNISKKPIEIVEVEIPIQTKQPLEVEKPTEGIDASTRPPKIELPIAELTKKPTEVEVHTMLEKLAIIVTSKQSEKLLLVDMQT